MKARNRVTSADVAELAEVSQSAVSRSFTPGASIAPKTREKVLEAAHTLGYRPNAIARSLISGRSRMIGLLAGYMDNPFYARVLDGLARALQAHGYHTLLFVTDLDDEDAQRDTLLERLLAFQVDGVVLASAPLSSRLARECENAGIPVVLLNRDVAVSDASSVVSDNNTGGKIVADFLIDGGHRHIGYIAGAADTSTNHERETGFHSALAARGRGVCARVEGNYERDRASAATKLMMAADVPPDAIFVASDMMAFAVLDTLRGSLNRRVPDDVSVVGFDDVPQAAWGAYRLTTIRQNTDELIAVTVDTLFAQIEDRNAPRSKNRVPVELVIRDTAPDRR